MEELIYQTAPKVTFATNLFVNVPIILQFDDTPLISIVREQTLGFTTEIPIFHPDGTYLAKVKGTRIYPTEDGTKAGLTMRRLVNMTVCEMGGKTLFEITHEKGDAFKAYAELHTPNGFFVKYRDFPTPEVIKSDGGALQFGSIHMSHNTIVNSRIGIWLKSNGSFKMACS